MINNNTIAEILGGAQNAVSTSTPISGLAVFIHSYFWPIVELLIIGILVVIFKVKLRRTNSALYLQGTKTPTKRTKNSVVYEDVVEEEDLEAAGNRRSLPLSIRLPELTSHNAAKKLLIS